MKAYVSVTVIYPSGFYDQITIEVDAKHDKNPSPYFEMLSVSCLSGRAIKSGDDMKKKRKSNIQCKINIIVPVIFFNVVISGTFCIHGSSLLTNTNVVKSDVPCIKKKL